MARFNAAATGTKTVNLAGGQAYSQSPELELVSILLTSFANDKFYEKASDTFERLKFLVGVTNKEFVAKAAVYARTKFGMRSISHVVASELARHVAGQKWAKDFYNAVVYRPDDMMEILAYHASKNGKITNAMKKGIAKAFSRFDKYALAKYRGESKEFSLVDIANLVHPKPNGGNREAIAALMKGDLKSFDTWETKLTEAGQKAETEDEKLELKKDAWKDLIENKKIKYFALLRNLRNIIEQAPEVLPAALEMLTNEALIKKSLVLPFRFYTAFEELMKLAPSAQLKMCAVAINKAIDIATNNVPKYDGETLVVLDVSGSMAGRPGQIGALFAAVLVKSNNADFMTFSDDAQYRNVNIADSTTTIANSMNFSMGGTNFQAIFNRMNKKYDRVVILSDMQGWIGGGAPTAEVNKYKAKYNADPYIYSFDLNGYGSMQFPERNVFAIAGFSEKIFGVMSLMEQDRQALINEIRKVEF